jgi:hypothetical protein
MAPEITSVYPLILHKTHNFETLERKIAQREDVIARQGDVITSSTIKLDRAIQLLVSKGMSEAEAREAVLN